jgi:GNAT superfamily N-acetyltransferase
MLIRPATADDADSLSDLAHRAKAHWGYPVHWMREWAAQHGHGVGRALVMHALSEARRRRAAVVELLSDPFATGFYERLGARRTGDVPAPMPGARDRTLPKFEFVLI